MELKRCPKCEVNVLPANDDKCPGCGGTLTGVSTVTVAPPDEKPSSGTDRAAHQASPTLGLRLFFLILGLIVLSPLPILLLVRALGIYEPPLRQFIMAAIVSGGGVGFLRKAFAD